MGPSIPGRKPESVRESRKMAEGAGIGRRESILSKMRAQDVQGDAQGLANYREAV